MIPPFESDRQAEGTDPSADRPASTIKPRVLVVDDALDNRLLITRILELSGYDVTTAPGGYEALELVADGCPFDLILMDLQMPEIDGFRTMRHMRDKGIKTQIWAVTAHAFEGISEKCLALGFDYFMAKPLSISTLREKVASQVKQNSCG